MSNWLYSNTFGWLNKGEVFVENNPQWEDKTIKNKGYKTSRNPTFALEIKGPWWLYQSIKINNRKICHQFCRWWGWLLMKQWQDWSTPTNTRCFEQYPPKLLFSV